MEQPQDDNARFQSLEQMARDHAARILFLEDLMARVITLQEVVVQLLQRREEDTDDNGTA
jgi:hypothetical protein